jgi:hypothetical protein
MQETVEDSDHQFFRPSMRCSSLAIADTSHPTDEPAMKTNRPTKLFTVKALALNALVLVSLLVPMLVSAPAGEASTVSSSPCPQYSIHDVFADPSGNWDGDQVNNSDELYNGLNPCIVDTTIYCASGGNPLCTYYTYLYIGHSSQCQQSVDAYPTGDYDRDGIPNADEVRQGANPCAHPCPYPTNADLALNPNGSWDSDGISNAIEVSEGTNPCSGITYDPCPNYSLAQVRAMADLDWDHDGIANAIEVRQGTNPCHFNSIQRLPHVTQQSTNRLSHVNNMPHTVYVAPNPPTPLCPHGYPYFHQDNGLCYANPVRPSYPY